jgi:ubiquitin carboxyl-terminal hydrolase 9/24
MTNNSQNEACGLIVHAQQFNQSYSDEHQDCFDKILNMMHELRRIRAVAKWMDQNQQLWAWMEPENEPDVVHPQQSRGDYSVRRGGANHYEATHMSDEEDDEDFDDDQDEPSGPMAEMYKEVVVKNCGVPEINGVYKQSGYCDGVFRYSKTGMWEGKQEDFMLFRCKLSDDTRRWYISIVPGNGR